jgi:hypothetical protein
MKQVVLFCLIHYNPCFVSFSTGTMARILQRASQPVHPLLEPAKELRPGQQLERGWSPHQVKFLLEAYF